MKRAVDLSEALLQAEYDYLWEQTTWSPEENKRLSELCREIDRRDELPMQVIFSSDTKNGWNEDGRYEFFLSPRCVEHTLRHWAYNDTFCYLPQNVRPWAISVQLVKGSDGAIRGALLTFEGEKPPNSLDQLAFPFEDAPWVQAPWQPF